jgi:hypothetical protein
MKTIIKLIPCFLYQLSCMQEKHHSTNNYLKEEHIVLEIDEKTDSISKVFKATMKNANSSRFIIKGYWNDTVMIMNTLMPKQKIDHNGIDEYHNDNPPIRWSFKKYKATKYHIRYEVVFYQKYFESYKDNYYTI